MKCSILHERATVGSSSGSLCYELDAERYPTLGNEFFTRLREKYPRAFRRSIPLHVGWSPARSSSSSGDTDSIWSPWECNGDYDKAVVKEAGGILVPCSELSVDERLKHNCDCYKSAKETGAELLVALRNLRSALLTDSSSVIAEHDIVGSNHSGDGSIHDAASYSSPANSVSQNSSHESELIQDKPTEDGEETVGVSSVQSGECHLKTGINDITAGSVTNTDHNILQMNSVDMDHSAAASSLVQDDVERQLTHSDGMIQVSNDVSLPAEPRQTVSDQRSQLSTRATTVDAFTKEQQISDATETGFADDNYSDVQQHHNVADGHQLDTLSQSFSSLSGHHVITDRKPPLMKKEKTSQRNIKSLFRGNVGNSSSSSSFAFNFDRVPEAPGSAEMVRRKLRLPWKKKKRYMPGKELSRWRSNFESWRSTSQTSLDMNSEPENAAADSSLWRTFSHNELQNVDTVSVGWTDSDTDTATSDDPMGDSFNERTMRLMAMSPQSFDSSTDTQQSSGWRSSLRSSARKRLSSFQKSAGRQLRRLQKSLTVEHAERNSDVNDFDFQRTADISVSSGRRVRHDSDSSSVSSRRSDIESPRHFRPIGRILSHNVSDGTTTIELVRPPHGPYGIYLARDGDDLRNKMYVSRLSDGLPVHFYAGLLRVGDEVKEINGIAVSGLSLDAVLDMIALSSKLVLQLQPTEPTTLM